MVIAGPLKSICPLGRSFVLSPWCALCQRVISQNRELHGTQSSLAEIYLYWPKGLGTIGASYT